jgi:hypothetical protein
MAVICPNLSSIIHGIPSHVNENSKKKLLYILQFMTSRDRDVTFPAHTPHVQIINQPRYTPLLIAINLTKGWKFVWCSLLLSRTMMLDRFAWSWRMGQICALFPRRSSSSQGLICKGVERVVTRSRSSFLFKPYEVLTICFFTGSLLVRWFVKIVRLLAMKPKFRSWLHNQRYHVIFFSVCAFKNNTGSSA